MAPWLIFELLLLILVPATEARAKHSQSRNLLPVHWPDVSKLEPEVREQLASLEKDLRAAINQPDPNEATLAESFGKAGKIYHAYSLTLPAGDCYLNAKRLAPKDFRWPYLVAKIAQQEGRIERGIPKVNCFEVNRHDIVVFYQNILRAPVAMDEAHTTCTARLDPLLKAVL